MHLKMMPKLLQCNKKIKIKRKHMSTIYENLRKLKYNLDLSTNLVSLTILGRVMLDPLLSQSFLAPFSITRLGIKNVPPWALRPPLPFLMVS